MQNVNNNKNVLQKHLCILKQLLVMWRRTDWVSNVLGVSLETITYGVISETKNNNGELAPSQNLKAEMWSSWFRNYIGVLRGSLTGCDAITNKEKG